MNPDDHPIAGAQSLRRVLAILKYVAAATGISARSHPSSLKNSIF